MFAMPLLLIAVAVPPANVVLVTWDGVRREDFLDADRLPRFWKTLAADSLILGGRSGPGIEVADRRMLSLPAYQSIFVGAVTDCSSNGCGRVRAETFPERLVRELALPRSSVAVFASWSHVADAVEHVAGTVTVDAGPHGVWPWNDTRRDAETVERALRYLREQRPRFLYLALGEADDQAHSGDLERYRATLLDYDRWLEALVRALASLGEYGERTTVIVTTDHGRDAGAGWTRHSSGDAHAGSIWLIALGPGVKPGNATLPATHLHLRPTIEALFGLCPAHATIEEIAPPACGDRR